MVTVVWDTWLKPGTEAEGLQLTRKVWYEMRGFDGYFSHQILIDQQAPGHIIALARWRSLADPDAVREGYKDSGDDSKTHAPAGAPAGTMGDAGRRRPDSLRHEQYTKGLNQVSSSSLRNNL